MFAIKLVGLLGELPTSNNYRMISCDSFTVSYPDNNAVTGTSDDAYPMIGVTLKHGDTITLEGFPVRGVAYIINENGKTIDTIRP